MKTVLSATFCALAVAAAALTSSEAHATPTTMNCTVTKVWVDAVDTMNITCGNKDFWTNGAGGQCPAASADAKRKWESIAVSSLLTGKQVTMSWDTVCGNASVAGFFGLALLP